MDETRDPDIRDYRRRQTGTDITEAIELLAIANAFAYMRAYAERTHYHWDRDEDSKVGKRLLALSGELPGYDPKLDEIAGVIERLCERCDKFMEVL